MARSRMRTVSILVPLALVVLLVGACSKTSTAGTYVHAEEGTIVVTDGGTGTWTQEGDDEPATFTWTQNGDDITFTIRDKTAGGVKLEGGNLVIPPDMISGDDPVTFTRQ